MGLRIFVNTTPGKRETDDGVPIVLTRVQKVWITRRSTVEPRLSEPCRRHTIGSDKREVRIGGVASEMSIGRVYGGR